MIMYSDRLSQLSLKKDKYWPHDFLRMTQGGIPSDPHFTPEQVTSFDLSAWIAQKLAIPNDKLPRIHHYPHVEFLLTEEELKAIEDGYIISSPVLCPNIWNKGKRSSNKTIERLEWLVWQDGWAKHGYPFLPKVLVDEDQSWGKIYEKLVYEPFIIHWKEIPDDFWIKLSYYLEEENAEDTHRGLILAFLNNNRIFPSPNLYNPELDTQRNSLYLSKDYWNSLIK